MHRYDVTEANETKWWPQILAALSTSLALFCYGMHYGWPSPFLSKLDASGMGLSTEAAALVSSVPFVGGAIGAIACAYLMDVVGRQTVLLLLAGPYVAAWVTIAFAETITPLLIARTIVGVSAGAAFTVVPIYIGEIAEPAIRGALGTTVTVQWNLGILTTYCIGPFVDIPTMSYIGCLGPASLFLLVLCVPESPYHLVAKSRIVQAEASLRYLRGRKDVAAELANIQHVLAVQTVDKGTVYDMFANTCNRRALFILFGLTVVQEFSGRVAFTFYSQSIFEQAGGALPASLCSIIYATTQLTAAVGATFLVDRWGRKPLLMLSTVGAAVALAVEAVFFTFKSAGVNMSAWTFVPLVGLMVYIIMFTIGLGIVPMVFAGEIFASNVKSKCACAVDICAAVTSMVVANCFQLLTHDVDEATPFWCFTGSCLVGIVFIYYFVPETSMKSFDDIYSTMAESNIKSPPTPSSANFNSTTPFSINS